jgi:UrcA family protein
MNYDAPTHIALFAKVSEYTLICATVALFAIAAIAPAHSATPGEVPSVTVKYDASKANTESGAMELYGRLMFAARQVCPSDESQYLVLVVQSHQCQKEAVARAVSQLHNRRLVEIAAAHSNRG